MPRLNPLPFSSSAVLGLAMCLGVALAGNAKAEIALDNWKLTLPVDEKGKFSGEAKEVHPLTSKFQHPPYYYTGKNGELIFSAPTNGATTKGSHYPRSELREMKNGTEAKWKINDGGVLSASLAVNEVPKPKNGEPGRVVIGQIHGPKDELCRLYYDNGKLYFYDDKAGDSQKETQFILKSESGQPTNIPFNARFNYMIKVADGKLVVTAKYKDQTYTATDVIGKFWPGKELYFKAGVYVQVAAKDAGTIGTGNGTVSFYELVLNGELDNGGDDNNGGGGDDDHEEENGDNNKDKTLVRDVKIKKSSGSDGNKPENVLDGKMTTRWSDNDKSAYIVLDLGKVRTIKAVDIAWYKGDSRQTTYSLMTSENDIKYQTEISKAKTSGRTANYSPNTLKNVKARYIKIVGAGSTQNPWTSISEVRVYEAKK